MLSAGVFCSGLLLQENHDWSPEIIDIMPYAKQRNGGADPLPTDLGRMAFDGSICSRSRIFSAHITPSHEALNHREQLLAAVYWFTDAFMNEIAPEIFGAADAEAAPEAGGDVITIPPPRTPPRGRRRDSPSISAAPDAPRPPSRFTSRTGEHPPRQAPGPATSWVPADVVEDMRVPHRSLSRHSPSPRRGAGPRTPPGSPGIKRTRRVVAETAPDPDLRRHHPEERRLAERRRDSGERRRNSEERRRSPEERRHREPERRPPPSSKHARGGNWHSRFHRN